MSFYDAERVLSAIAKFLVHLFGEGNGRGEGRGKERKWGQNWESVEVREMRMHEKISPKRNRFGIWGRSLGIPPRVIHFYRASAH